MGLFCVQLAQASVLSIESLRALGFEDILSGRADSPAVSHDLMVKYILQSSATGSDVLESLRRDTQAQQAYRTLP
jgi:hypothetical protein